MLSIEELSMSSSRPAIKAQFNKKVNIKTCQWIILAQIKIPLNSTVVENYYRVYQMKPTFLKWLLYSFGLN